MSTDEFTRLFKYMEELFNQIDKRFDDTDAWISRITGTLDTSVKLQ